MESNVKNPTIAEIMARIEAFGKSLETLLARIEALETASKSSNKSEREMTDEDARRVLIGDLKDAKHGDAAKALNLSYGQVYSARGEYTFRHIHKELKARPEGFKNPWNTAS